MNSTLLSLGPPYILFHVEILGTLNEVGLKPESLFGNIDEMRGH